MTVSKRARYEVLRRDNHTCRYCGGAAPNVVLTIDHVTPVSLGGTDDPGNLVAACKDCNAGKSSSAPDAATVEQVSDDAVRWAKAIKAAANAEVRSIRKARKEAGEVYETWQSLMPWHAKLPDDWEKSVNGWRKMGLPLEVITEAIYASATSRAPSSAKFAYMAKICWTRLTDLQNEARKSLGVPQASDSAKCDHGCDPEDGCFYVSEDSACPKCGTVGCAYVHGWEDASYGAWNHAYGRFAHRDVGHRALESVVDRRPPNGWAA